MKFPYPKTKQEVWHGSWASCDYVYLIYIVDKKQMVGFFLPLKKNMYLWLGIDIPTKRFFESEKKWVTWSVTKMNGFFVAHPWKELYICMHTHTHYMYIYIFVNYALRIGMSTHQYQLVSISKLCAGLASSGVIGPYQTQATRHWRWHKVLESCAKRQRMTSCCGLKRWVYYGWPGHRRSGWEWQGGHRGDPRTLKMVW